MISVIVPTLNDEASLVAALTPLVPASMEGLIRELIVVDAGSTDATLEIAEDAGARVVVSSDGAKAGLPVAKGPWILVLDPTVILKPGWEEAVRTHLGARRTSRLTLPGQGGGFWSGLFPRGRAVLSLKQARTVDGGR